MICKRCGVEYVKERKTKYCSEECQKQAQLDRAKAERLKKDKTKTVICMGCGKPFQTDTHKLYCCDGCKPPKINKHNKIHKKICLHCGIGYNTHHTEQMYCSKHCMGLARRKPETQNIVKTLPICAVCGKEFNGYVNSKRCSDGCRKEYSSIRSYKRSKEIHNNKTNPRECGECGISFNPEYGNKHRCFCSNNCSIRFANRVVKQKRRAVKKNAFVAPVSYKLIYERDGGICQLCGKKVRMQIKWPDQTCGSIDHIIPLSIGGTHEPKNVQLAHHICNSFKGNRAMGEQIRLC